MASTEKTFIDNYDFQNLSNESEHFVFEELEKQLTALTKGKRPRNICVCNDCVLDMATMALNNVRPLYHYSLLGTLYSASASQDEDYKKSVQKAVRLAIEKVSTNPSHS